MDRHNLSVSGWDEKTSASAPKDPTAGDSDYSANAYRWSLSDLYYYADYTVTSTSDPYYSNNTITLTKPTKNEETSTYKVTFNANGGTMSTPSTTTVTKTTTYEFLKWTGTTGVTINGTNCTFKQTGTVTANYTPNTTPAKISSMPTPTRPGYEFLGWSTSQSTNLIPGGNSSPEITADIVYIANWKVKGTIRIYIEEDKKYRMALPYLHDGTKWKMAIPYMHNGTKYYIIAG